MRPLVAGNWKMNGVAASLGELDAIVTWSRSAEADGVALLICPPATLLARAAERASGSSLAIGGQDCHTHHNGAHTGDVSGEMIRDAGATHVIVGHSERRTDHGETDAIVRAKAGAALAAGLIPVVCVGETEAQRDAGEADAIVAGQLAGSLPDEIAAGPMIIAYEPVWAIGTGRTPSRDEIAAMHGTIRAALVARFGAAGAAATLLYGGSVKPDNAGEILALDDVDGALVGGASLTAPSFIAIATAAKAAL